MDNGNKGQPPQARVQQNNASTSNRNPTSVYTGLMQSSTTANIWASRPESLPRDHTTGTTSTQRSTALGAADSNNIWARPAPNTWNSSDSQQFRPSASRSTSPPNSAQNGSNASPSFSTRIANNTSNTGFAGTNNYASPYADTTQGNGGLFQQSLMGLRSGSSQPNQPLYEDAGRRDSHPSTSRHPEGETPPPTGRDTNAFSTGFGTHSRHASRMSVGGISNFTPQQIVSRSQSQSFLPGSEHSRAASEAAQNVLYRPNLQATSSGPRVNGALTNHAAASGWPEFAPMGNGNLNELRRGSVANSVYQPATTTNSPQTFTPRQNDAWENAMTPQESEVMNSLQRQLNSARQQNTQSPYAGLSFDPYSSANIQAQMMQQMHNAYPSPYQHYGYQPGFYPPTGPAGMMARGGRPQDPTAGLRCQELEEYRRSSKSNRKWELKNVFGHVVEFAGDQQGSRFLQEKIPLANSDDRQRVFDEIMVNANALMVDVFGNYVIQQLFVYGTMIQKKQLAAKMKDNVVQLSMQLYGCRCVQEALIYVLVEQQVELAKELEPEILRVMKNDNGNHVVQKVLSKVPRDRIDFIYDAVRGRVFELSQQQYACRVIQRMIEKGSEEDKAFLLAEFQEHAPRLVTDNWGNYVVQAVIREGGPDARSKVIRLCIDHFHAFSKQKVASNVMEHCIKFGTEEDLLEMYRLITADGSSLLQTMWKDNFANYVVQQLCHCLTGAEQATLVNESRPYFESRKKPSRPDDKWLEFEKLINRFSVPPSRQGSISSIGGGAMGVSVSRPPSQSGSAMPTPGLTTGGNSPRTSSSQDTGDATLDPGDGYLVEPFSKVNLHADSADQVA